VTKETAQDSWLTSVPAGLGTCDEGICAGDSAGCEGVAGGDINANENDVGLQASLALRCDGTVNSFEVVNVACDVVYRSPLLVPPRTGLCHPPRQSQRETT